MTSAETPGKKTVLAVSVLSDDWIAEDQLESSGVDEGC